MKYIFALVLLVIGSISAAQNLHIGLGLANTGITVDLKDKIDGELKSSNTTSAYFNPVNLLLELELGKHLALKTGSYFLVNYADYPCTELVGIWINGIRVSKSYKTSRDFEFTSLDIPVLLTFKSLSKDEKYEFNLNAGPYFGYIIPFLKNRTPYGDSPKINCGLNLSAGYGTKKWQMNCYFLTGRMNIKIYPTAEMIKEKSTTIGFNLTRVIHFSKKEIKSLKN